MWGRFFRHAVLIAAVYCLAGWGIHWTLTKFYHPTLPEEVKREPVESAAEDIGRQKNRPVINTGIFFGSEDIFRKAKPRLSLVDVPERLFLSKSPVRQGWVMGLDSDGFLSSSVPSVRKVYWTEDFFYVTRPYLLGKGRYLESGAVDQDAAVKSYYQQKSNATLVGVMVFLAGLCSYLIIFFCERRILGSECYAIYRDGFDRKNILRSMAEGANTKAYVLRLRRGRGDVNFLVYPRSLDKRNVFRPSRDFSPDLRLDYTDFLDKCGKRPYAVSVLESVIEAVLFLRNRRRCWWIIDLKTLLAGIEMADSAPEKFHEALAKIKNGQEFLVYTGIS